MADATWQNQLLLQFMSRTPTRWRIDCEVGDLTNDLLTPEPALSYLRYNVRLEEGHLEALGFSDLADQKRVVALREMSVAENRFDLARIGGEAARRHVKDEHFPAAFDIPGGTAIEAGSQSIPPA